MNVKYLHERRYELIVEIVHCLVMERWEEGRRLTIRTSKESMLTDFNFGLEPSASRCIGLDKIDVDQTYIEKVAWIESGQGERKAED